MDALFISKIFTSIGDGVIFFYLLFEYTQNKAPLRMILSGICAGLVFNWSNSYFTPFSLQNCILCISVYFITGWVLVFFTRTRVRFKDYLFIFAVVYFSNIGASLIAILFSIVLGFSLVDLVNQSALYMLLVNIWLYSVVLAFGLYILTKRDQIQLVSAVGASVYVNIAIGTILFSTLFLSLVTIIDKNTPQITGANQEGIFYQALVQPALTVLMICILYAFFFILSRYSFRHEILKTRLLHQETITDGLVQAVDELRPLKHNIRNRFAVIHALAASQSRDALTEYVDSCTEDLSLHKEPSVLAVAKITHLGLSGLLSSALREIQKCDIPLDLSIDFQQSVIDMKVSDLCDIVGIFIDNALEASKEMAGNAHIRVLLTNDHEFFVASIENYYSEPVSVDKIFLKGYSSKGSHRGIGLWHVQSLLQNYDHATLSCHHKDNYFIQTITVQNSGFDILDTGKSVEMQ